MKHKIEMENIKVDNEIKQMNAEENKARGTKVKKK